MEVSGPQAYSGRKKHIHELGYVYINAWIEPRPFNNAVYLVGDRVFQEIIKALHQFLELVSPADMRSGGQARKPEYDL